MTPIVDRVECIVQDKLGDWPRQWEGFHWPGYTYEHTLRVRSLALALGEREGADPQVVELAALLHDIEKEVGKGHAAAGAETAERILAELEVDEALASAVCDAIATHTGGNTPDHPVENLVLGDADLIDANFGLVATWRFITIRAGHRMPMDETISSMAEWLPKKEALRDVLLTEAAKEITAARSARMQEFCRQLAEAWANGERNGEFDLPDLAEFITARHQTANLGRQIAELREATPDGREVSAAVAEILAGLEEEMAGRA
jgi:uncharacterized protein